MQIISKDEKARMLYEAREAELRDQLTRIETAENIGRAKGKAEGTAEVICQYLEACFGVDSQALQDIIRLSINLDGLNQITNGIFNVSSLDEAKSLVQAFLAAQ